MATISIDSLNDVGVPNIKNYVVGKIKPEYANNFVKKFHYSGKVVSNSQIHLGVILSNKLVGCLQYGPPMNGNKTAEKISNFNNMVELNRMAMDDIQPRNAESRAIGLCNKWLKQNTNLDYVLSFSDGKQNNVGYIYQASNWIYFVK